VFSEGWAVSVPRAGRLVPASISGADRPARAVAAWRDGSVAAVAGREGEACVVITAFPIDTGVIVHDPSYPELVRHLVLECQSGAGPSGSGRLDSGAIAVLAGSGAEEDTAVSEMPPGRSLAWPLLFLALLLAVGEWPLRNRRRSQES
jgi:hypothetical protein